MNGWLRLSPYAAAMGVILSGFLMWVLIAWRLPPQLIVILVWFIAVLFLRSVPKSHDGDGPQI